MKRRIRNLLRRLLLSTDERAACVHGEAYRQWFHGLDQIERDVIATLRHGARPVPGAMPAIDADEARKWAAVLASPIGRKVDVCMHDLAAQHAQWAIGRAGEELQHACGFARGYLAAWHMAKTLSRIANAEVGKPEPDADTAAAELEHYQP